MKQKVTVVVDFELRTVVDIIFHTSILNIFLGKDRLKSFHKKRILGIPIQDFDSVIYDDVEGRWLYFKNTELEVYTLIKRTKINCANKIIPYITHLLCLPAKEPSDISYEELDKLYQESEFI